MKGSWRKGQSVEEEGAWEVSHFCFADDMALLEDSSGKLHEVVSGFGRIYERRKLKMNVN